MIDYTKTRLNEDGIKAYKHYTALCAAKTYIPTRPQADAIKEIGIQYDNKKIYLVTSGNGAGKSTSVQNILLNAIYGSIDGVPLNIYDYAKDEETGEEFPGFFNYPFFTDFPDWPHKCWYISNQSSLMSLHTKFKSWAPKGELIETFSETEFIKESKAGKTYVSECRFKRTDWILNYKSIDQDLKTFESDDVGIIIIDEPVSQRIFSACISRLRCGGIIIIVATPLMDAGWFVDKIIDKIEDDKDKFHQTVKVWSNCIERAGDWDLGVWGIQKKGNLHEKDIEAQLRNYPDQDEIPARESGEFMHLSGLIFKMYESKKVFKEINIITTTPMNYLYRFVLDPHDRKPPAASWYRLDQFGTVEKIREYPNYNDPEFGGRLFIDIKDSGRYTIQDFVKIFMEIEIDLKIPPSRIMDIIDPNFGMKRTSETGKRIHQLYSQASGEVGKRLGTMRRYSFLTNVNDSLAPGHKSIKAMLKPNLHDDYPYYIDIDCINTDLAYRRYSWKKDSAKAEDEHGLTDKIEQKYKDFIDLDRYCFMLPWDYVFPQKFVSEYTNEDYGEKENWQERIMNVKRPEGAEGC